jgi:sulfoxide reductase heme-binding subunit YedZ
MTQSKTLKRAVRLGIWLWFGYWIAQIFVGDLGASPALTLNHRIGTIVFVLLSVNITLGVALSLLKPAPKWLRFWLSERRFWGVSTFLILTTHVFFYFLNEGFEPKAWTQMITKTYLMFASLAFLILFVLALTSNDFSVRKLGGKCWKHIQRSVYAVQILLFGHLLLIEKANVIKYAIWLFALLVAQGARWLVVFWARPKRP